jgi:hypothetical protein
MRISTLILAITAAAAIAGCTQTERAMSGALVGAAIADSKDENMVAGAALGGLAGAATCGVPGLPRCAPAY